MADPRRTAPWLSTPARELKLAIVAGLASLQLAGLLQLASEPTDAPPPEETLPTATLAPSPRTREVWLSTLTGGDRPEVVVPEGWRVIEDPSQPSAAPAPTPTRRPAVRVAAARTRRVRTRSS